MTRLKKLFSTPKKAVITSICILAALAIVGTGTVYGARAITSDNKNEANAIQNTAVADVPSETSKLKITMAEAKNIALLDAGLAQEDVTFTETKLDWDDNIPIYDIDFYSANAKYEYEISASTGLVFSKSKEIGNDRDYVTLEAAKSTALSDAGVSTQDASFTKAHLDYDDGIPVYDIEFYTSTHEYDYEIDAVSGSIRDKDFEAFKVNQSSDTNTSFIGIDKAKSIAAEHAGLSLSGINFTKAKLENDDGYTEYEIEFYYNGMEYEYTINAVTGAIMEYDYEEAD